MSFGSINTPVELCIWTDDDASTVSRIDASMRLIIASSATTVAITGYLPVRVTALLVQTMLRTSREVSITNMTTTMLGHLCAALKNPDCGIEELRLYLCETRCLARFEYALAVNTSLRHIHVLSGHCVTGMRFVYCVPVSKVIEHVTYSSTILLPVDAFLYLAAMPSLCGITASSIPHSLRLAWSSGFELARDTYIRERRPLTSKLRQTIYAILECLCDVLPPGVVDDIIALAIEEAPYAYV